VHVLVDRVADGPSHRPDSSRARGSASKRRGLPSEAEVDLPFDVGPFLSSSQPPHEFLEGDRMLGRELEPCEEVERLTEVAAVVQTPRDRREVSESDGDVM